MASWVPCFVSLMDRRGSKLLVRCKRAKKGKATEVFVLINYIASMRILIWLSACLGLLICTPARADLRFERFLPENPTADTEVQVEIWFSNRAGVICDFPLSMVFEEVTLSGNSIRAQVVTSRLPTDSGVFCTAGPFTPVVRSYALGRFPAGNYTVQLLARDVNSPTRPLIQIATVPLSIAAGTLVQVPLNTGFGLGLLAIGLLGFGIIRLRSKAKLSALCL